MNKFSFYIAILSVSMLLISCQDFFNPNPEVVINEKDFFKTFEDFRTAEMGLYALQQEMVEELVIMGELRADLLEVTENADPDLIDIHKLNISPNNPYTSPVNFYKLIANCNNLIRKIEARKPSVANPLSLDNIDNFDRLYGSVISIRAWAYFYAVRIYGKVPYIPSKLTTVDQIQKYINDGAVIIDDYKVVFDNDGYSSNDTIFVKDTIDFPQVHLNVEAVVDTFTNELLSKIKRITRGNETTIYVGVDHNTDGVNDNSWEVTTWNQYAYSMLLGQMYLTVGNLVEAEKHFHKIVYFTSPLGQANRYCLANNISRITLTRTYHEDGVRPYRYDWGKFYSSIDIFEHIFVLPFNKSQRQQNDLNTMFSNMGTNKYVMKPTEEAVFLWEGDEWRGWNPQTGTTSSDFSDDQIYYNGVYYTGGAGGSGIPGDFSRGNQASYAYVKDGAYLSDNDVNELLYLKYIRRDKEVQSIIQDMDTVVYKYMIGQASESNAYKRDINFVVYSAVNAHLYMTEILSNLIDITAPVERTFRPIASSLLKDENINHYNNRI